MNHHRTPSLPAQEAGRLPVMTKATVSQTDCLGIANKQNTHEVTISTQL
ncbi:hypothetical protein HMPREF1549_02065 [Actinomyces johnsonii F0510]|uniref:Uncharacterized protein n=1 Tax=Actinomyces johnsonii F0510 TaxID=1227262 RepID=U1PPL6_9ACTO|nr:hypothetical protein HMPREF1549_02065 [Actinomyces johnsonii F0510]